MNKVKFGEFGTKLPAMIAGFLLIMCPFSEIWGQKDGSGKAMAEKVRKDRARGITLPPNVGAYQQVHGWVEDEPDADYLHAPEKSHEAFRDIKFSIRIHWGVYSMLEEEASWPLLKMSAEKKMAYQNLYKTFNPVNFNAQEWMDLFKRSGIQAFAFTTKHSDGFSMFHTKARVKERANYLDSLHILESCDLAYSIEETPFKRDIVKELCDAAHKNNIKIDLYYSHPDWYDADFRPLVYHPLTTQKFKDNPLDYGNDYYGRAKAEWEKYEPFRIMTPEPTAEAKARLIARHRKQLMELVNNYGKIDMLCLDMWLGREQWPGLKETVKMIRKAQPDLMIRVRGIANYGDYYQPEQFVPDNVANTNMPWMSICLLGNIFAYDPVAEHYKGAPWVIHNLIDCVAKGGSFMVCLGPDQTGVFHPKAVEQLEEVGRWLKVNGEGIYETRLRKGSWKENDIYFTRSKDHSRVYAFTEKWPGTEILIPAVTPKNKSKVYLLGHKKPLQWSQIDGGIKVIIPEELQTPENRPCVHAWGFKMEVNK
jgi:alpha-L-fucosidase